LNIDLSFVRRRGESSRKIGGGGDTKKKGGMVCHLSQGKEEKHHFNSLPEREKKQRKESPYSPTLLTPNEKKKFCQLAHASGQKEGKKWTSGERNLLQFSFLLHLPRKRGGGRWYLLRLQGRRREETRWGKGRVFYFSLLEERGKRPCLLRSRTG